jgi:hypothetical protein
MLALREVRWCGGLMMPRGLARSTGPVLKQISSDGAQPYVQAAILALYL